MLPPLLVIYPHGHTTNCVATDDLGKWPDCGKCHQPLFTDRSVALHADIVR